MITSSKNNDLFRPTAKHLNLIRRYSPFFILGFVVLITAAIYLSTGLRASGQSTPVMPLDDAYIHFQYAKVLAQGSPFHYNPDQPATSGATSFLYPVILAVGYRIGFQGEGLAWWALLIGVVCWIGSTWLVYLISIDYFTESVPAINRRAESKISHPPNHPFPSACVGGEVLKFPRLQYWIAFGVAVAFALTGSIGWAAMSGMETSLTIFLTLLVLWYVIRLDRRGAIIAGALITLTRPEGLAIALVAILYIEYQTGSWRSAIGSIAVIALAGITQPALNFIATGSATASGLQAKSFLYNIPTDAGFIANSIFTTFVRIWRELITGYSPDDGYYIMPFLLLLTLIGLPFVRRAVPARKRFDPIIVIIVWLLALSLALSTLETAFWQFKRYQQPMIALFYPLLGWGLLAAIPAINRRAESALRGIASSIVSVIVMVVIGFSIATSVQFVRYYGDNVHEVAFSQKQMAHYVATSIPANAIIGVHDIGVMRYLGNHATYDVIGLTTPGAARAWRNGPGSVYEQMRTSPWRPDYFAIYPDARGLTYFDGTGLFRTKIASFPSSSPPRNVASATNSGQNVYQADWTYSTYADQPHQSYSLAAIKNMTLIDQVNVADLASEDAHHYRWWEDVQRPGFPSEVYEFKYVDCQPLPDNPTCKVMDGGRLMTGGEEMTIKTQPGQDLIWITRVHPHNVATLNLYINGQSVGTRVVPAIPGQWLEIATFVPGKLITSAQTQVRVEANITDPNVGFYMPYYHWFYQGSYAADNSVTLPGPPASFGQAIKLVGRRLTYNPDQRTIHLDLEWQADNATVDAKTFIHVYDQAGHLVEGAQIDQRSGNGTLPPANWLSGTVRDSYTLTLPADLQPGTYQVAMGLYDPVSLQRLPVTGEGVGSDNRLFIGSIDVK